MEHLSIFLYQETQIAVISKLVYITFLFLILAIFVERATEIFVSIIKFIDLKNNWFFIWNRKAKKIRKRLDVLFAAQGSDAKDKKDVFSWILWNYISDSPNEGGKKIIAARFVRTQYYKIISRSFALAVSIVFSILMYKYLNVDLVTILNNIAQMQIEVEQTWIKILVTAILLAVGVEPLHQLILRFERVGQTKKND